MSKHSMKELEEKIAFRINHLDINQSYFLGKVKHGNDEFKINLQGHLKAKLLKLPFKIPHVGKVLVRLSGPNEVYVEDFLLYMGKSEWLEIDSDEILHYVADHQDAFDTLEIFW